MGRQGSHARQEKGELVEGLRAEEGLFVLGTDEQGRDLWSRLMYGTRTSLTIGLLGVAMSLVLGVVLGGISGLYGGVLDTVIQRIIEILRSIPTIPLWMGLGAALFNVPNAPQSSFTYGGYADLRFGSATIKIGPRFEYNRIAHSDYFENGWRITPLIVRVVH